MERMDSFAEKFISFRKRLEWSENGMNKPNGIDIQMSNSVKGDEFRGKPPFNGGLSP